MYAMLLARFNMFPEVKEKGMSSVPRLAAFTSEHVRLLFTPDNQTTQTERCHDVLYYSSVLYLDPVVSDLQ